MRGRTKENGTNKAEIKSTRKKGNCLMSWGYLSDEEQSFFAVPNNGVIPTFTLY